MAMPVWLKEKFISRRLFEKELPRRATRKFVFTEHHESHAASAFFPSPFEDAAILTIDGVGEWARRRSASAREIASSYCAS